MKVVKIEVEINTMNVVDVLNSVVILLIIIHFGRNPIKGGIPLIDMKEVIIIIFLMEFFIMWICLIDVIFILLNMFIIGIVINM